MARTNVTSVAGSTMVVSTIITIWPRDRGGDGDRPSSEKFDSDRINAYLHFTDALENELVEIGNKAE